MFLLHRNHPVTGVWEKYVEQNLLSQFSWLEFDFDWLDAYEEIRKSMGVSCF